MTFRAGARADCAARWLRLRRRPPGRRRSRCSRRKARSRACGRWPRASPSRWSPFGDPRLAEPFDIDCPEKGSRALGGPEELGVRLRARPAGRRALQLHGQAGSEDADGERSSRSTFSFTTGGPAVDRACCPIATSRSTRSRSSSSAWMRRSSRRHGASSTPGATPRASPRRSPVQLVTGEERLPDPRQPQGLRRPLSERAVQGRPRWPRSRERELQRGTRAEQLQRRTSRKLSAGAAALRAAAAQRRASCGWCGGRASSRCQRRADQPGSGARVHGAPGVLGQVLLRARESRRRTACRSCRCSLRFTAPIARAAAEKMLLRGADGKAVQADAAGSDAGRRLRRRRSDVRRAVSRAGAVQARDPRRSARRRRPQAHQPEALSADGARPTSRRRWRSSRPRFGIIELKADAMLPVTLRNLEAEVPGRQWSASDDARPVPGSVLRVGARQRARRSSTGCGACATRSASSTSRRTRRASRPRRTTRRPSRCSASATGRARSSVPKPDGARAFEVVGIPLKQPGFYVVELASPKLGAALLAGANPQPKSKPVYHVSTAALVTNLAVHFKQGRESSLVWVTALETGTPVAKAQVSVQDCNGKEHWKGVTDARGVARISKELPEREQPARLLRRVRPAVHGVRARRPRRELRAVRLERRHLALALQSAAASYDGPYIATTVFDRTLVRAGETVHMKLLLPPARARGLSLRANAPRCRAKRRSSTGQRQVRGAGQMGRAQTAPSATGRCRKDAKTGVYQRADRGQRWRGAGGAARMAGSFRVEEFRVPLMRAAIDPPAQAAGQRRQRGAGRAGELSRRRRRELRCRSSCAAWCSRAR